MENFDLESMVKVGEGSFGKVYSIKDKITSQRFALKLYKRVFDNDGIDTAVINEMNFLQYFDHPNIIKPRDITYDFKKKSIATVLPYYRYDLASAIDNKLIINKKRIVYQILSVLHYFHNNGIYHFDIKPANILYDEAKDDIMFIDFGSCEYIIDGMYPSAGDKNTSYWRPLEGFNKGDYGTFTDIWSAGLVIHSIYADNSFPFFIEGKVRSEQDIMDILSKLDDVSIGQVVDKCIDNVELQGIVKDMLTMAFEERPEIGDILDHPFFGEFEHKKRIIVYESFSDPVGYDKQQRSCINNILYDTYMTLGSSQQTCFLAIDIIDRCQMLMPFTSSNVFHIMAAAYMLAGSIYRDTSLISEIVGIIPNTTVEDVLEYQVKLWTALNFKLYRPLLCDMFIDEDIDMLLETYLENTLGECIELF